MSDEFSTVKSADGTVIAYERHGQGPAVVLIHGWLFSRAAFERQVNGELAERCRVIAYDLRGHGESGKPDNPAAYADGTLWAADLDCVLQAVGMERPVLAGWSLPGRRDGCPWPIDPKSDPRVVWRARAPHSQEATEISRTSRSGCSRTP